MKLDLPIPPGWKTSTLEEGTLYAEPDKEVGLLVLRLAAAPEDPEAWLKQALVHRAKGGPEPRNLKLSQHMTRAGWTMVCLDADVGDEARTVAYLSFFDYAATVIARCRRPKLKPSWREEILELLLGARPDFSQPGVVVSLHQMLGGPPPPVGSPPPGGLGAVWHWPRSFVGGDVVFAAEKGTDVGRIRVVHRVAPLRSVQEIFAPLLELREQWDTVDGPWLIATAEGEYAAFANATGPERQHTLGVVFGDDHYARIDGRVADPKQFGRFRAAVSQLTYSYSLGLGYARWRRFYYEPPPGWTGVARPRCTMWISPSNPASYQVMKVFDARPPTDNRAARQGARLYETLPEEFLVDAPRGPIVFQTAEGVRCQVVVYTGRVLNRRGTIHAIEGTVLDDRYIYPLRMECDAERYEETLYLLEKTVGSIRLLGTRGPDTDADMGVLTSWAE